jgi:hypothetical protein
MIITIKGGPDGRLLVDFSYDTSIITLQKTIRGHAWEPRTKTWNIPANAGQTLLQALYGLDRFNVPAQTETARRAKKTA